MSALLHPQALEGSALLHTQALEGRSAVLHSPISN